MLDKILEIKQTSAFLMRVSHCDQFNRGYRLCRQSRFSIKMIVVHPLFDSVAFLMCMRGMKSYRSEFLSLKVHTGKTKSNRLLYITSGFVRYSVQIDILLFYIISHFFWCLCRVCKGSSVSLCGLKLGCFCSPCVASCSPSVHAESHCAHKFDIPLLCVYACACWCVSACVCVTCIHPPLQPTQNLSNPLGLKKEIPPLSPGLLFLGVCASRVLQLLQSASVNALQSLYTGLKYVPMSSQKESKA